MVVTFVFGFVSDSVRLVAGARFLLKDMPMLRRRVLLEHAGICFFVFVLHRG